MAQAKKPKRRTKVLVPTPIAKASVKALTEKGMSIRSIAEYLGLSKSTVERYRKLKDENLTDLKEHIKLHHMLNDFELSSLASNKIKKKINTFKPFDLIGLYKISRELQTPKGHNQGNQMIVNIVESKDNKTLEINEEVTENE